MPTVTSAETQRMSGVTESYARPGADNINEMAVKVHLLGSMAVPGSAAAKLAPQARVVLAMLALANGKPVLLDEMDGEIWGSRRPKTARTVIQVYVSKIRRELAAVDSQAELITQPDGYLLHPSRTDTDVGLFHRYVARARAAVTGNEAGRGIEFFDRARELWLGEPLSDVRCGPTLLTHRRQLNALHAEVMEQRSEVMIRLGRDREAVADLHRLTVDDPFSENACAWLMVALSRSGHRMKALDAFHRVRIALREELGIEPGPLLQRVQQAVLAGSDPLSAACVM
jgi:SARP family transcriptional regulator, regulator of embCAB operon